MSSIRRRLGLAGVLAGMAFPALAQAAPPPGSTIDPAPEERRREDTDTLVLTGGAFLYEVIGIGGGVTLGLHVADRTLVEIDAQKTAALIPRHRAESAALRVQQLFGETFYLRAGVRLRRIDIRETVDLDFDEFTERTVQDDLGVDVSVGNRWRWSRFILGVDWLGLYVPVASLSTSERLEAKDNGEVLREESPGLCVAPDIRVAYLHLGFSL